MNTMAKEIETKFKIKKKAPIVKALKAMGAQFVSREYERDIYYHVVSSKSALSVIRFRFLKNGGLFTIKSARGQKSSTQYKVREEHEVMIDDAKGFCLMLKRIGFVPKFRKEKKRDTYRWKNAKIVIDELPYLGLYIEIEGPKKRIKEGASALSLSMDEAIAVSYMDLFNAYKKSNKKPNLELVFSPPKN